MQQYAWILWVAAMVVFAVVEAATVSVVSVWFIGGAAAALVVQLLGGGWIWQIVAFLVASALLLACLRPFVKKYVTPRKIATNAEALVGKEAVITEEVNNLLGTGALKLEGKTWSVRSHTQQVLPQGCVVKIVKIEGVKLVAEPVYAAAEQ